MTGLKQELLSLVPPGLAFRDPELLLLLLLVPLAIFLEVRRERRGDGALSVPTLAFVAATRPTWRLRLRHVPFALALLGYAGLVLALARPRLGLERTESWTEGVDVFIALDASGSMAAEDFKPKNRFHVAKNAVRQFIEGRTSDRIGLLTFAGRSRTVTPLTTDRQMLLTSLNSLTLGDQGDGTAIGMALGNALARLRPSKAKSKVIILVTDGGNNAGEIDPETAAGIAKALGVRVYTVGVGTVSGPVEIPISVRDPETGRVTERRVLANVDVDEALLQTDRLSRRADASSAPPTPRASPTRSPRSTGSRRARSRRATLHALPRESSRASPSPRPSSSRRRASWPLSLFPVVPE